MFEKRMVERMYDYVWKKARINRPENTQGRSERVHGECAMIPTGFYWEKQEVVVSRAKGKIYGGTHRKLWGNARNYVGDAHRQTCSGGNWTDWEYVLIDWVGGPDEKIFGSKSGLTDRAKGDPCVLSSEPNIFPSCPNSLSQYAFYRMTILFFNYFFWLNEDAQMIFLVGPCAFFWSYHFDS